MRSSSLHGRCRAKMVTTSLVWLVLVVLVGGLVEAHDESGVNCGSTSVAFSVPRGEKQNLVRVTYSDERSELTKHVEAALGRRSLLASAYPWLHQALDFCCNVSYCLT
jgi:hypothetical protein